MRTKLYLLLIAFITLSCGAELPFLSSGGSSGDSSKEDADTEETTSGTNEENSTSSSSSSSENAALTCSEKSIELGEIIKSGCNVDSDCNATCLLGSCTFSYNKNHLSETPSTITTKLNAHIDANGNNCSDSCIIKDCAAPNNEKAVCVEGSCLYTP